MATDLSDELLLLVLLDALFNLLRLEVVWVVEDVVAVQGLNSSNFLLLRFLLCFGEVLFCLNSPPFHVVRLHNAGQLLFDVLLLKLQSLKEVAVQVFGVSSFFFGCGSIDSIAWFCLLDLGLICLCFDSSLELIVHVYGVFLDFVLCCGVLV